MSAMFPQNLRSDGIKILYADGTAIIDLISAGSNGTRIGAISVTSSDTVDRTLVLYLDDGTNKDVILGRVLIPDGAGTNGTDKPVSVLNAINFPFLPEDLVFFLGTGSKIRLSMVAAISSSREIHVSYQAADY